MRKDAVKDAEAETVCVRLSGESVRYLKNVIRHYDLLGASQGLRKALEVTGKLLEKQAAKEGKQGTPE